MWKEFGEALERDFLFGFTEVMANHDTMQEADAGPYQGCFQPKRTADLYSEELLNLTDTTAAEQAGLEDSEEVSPMSLVLAGLVDTPHQCRIEARGVSVNL